MENQSESVAGSSSSSCSGVAGGSDQARAVITVPIRELNEYLGCKLCNGYFRDAHTIPDCLHTFCKACLFKYLQDSAVKECPLCKISLGPMPWTKVIFDRTIQDLVDKIFPHFSQQDKDFEALFVEKARKHEPATQDVVSSSKLPSIKRTKLPTDEDLGGGPTVSIRALPAWGDVPDSKKLPLLSKPLLRALVDVKVSKLQRFIQKRLASEDLQILPNQIEILFDNQPLDPNCSLNSVAAFVAAAEEAGSEPIIVTYKRG